MASFREPGRSSMVKKHLLKASLFAVLALFSVVAAAPAASVAPVLVLDNPSCADLGLVTLGSKFEPVVDKTQGPITIDVHGDTFDFTSTVPVGTVIVKGGPNANVYTYTTVTFSDTGLHAPNNGPDMFYGLSHVEFCAPPPHPAIDVVKVAVASPIPAGG